jgi:hypothetical protein
MNHFVGTETVYYNVPNDFYNLYNETYTQKRSFIAKLIILIARIITELEIYHQTPRSIVKYF